MAEFKKVKTDLGTLRCWRFLLWLEIAMLAIALIVSFAVKCRIFPTYYRHGLPDGELLLWLGGSVLIVPTLQRYRKAYHRRGFAIELKRRLDQVEAVDPTALDIDWNRQLGLDPAVMRCEWDWAFQGKTQAVPVQIGRFTLSKEGAKRPMVKNGLWIQLKGSWDYDSGWQLIRQDKRWNCGSSFPDFAVCQKAAEAQALSPVLRQRLTACGFAWDALLVRIQHDRILLAVRESKRAMPALFGRLDEFSDAEGKRCAALIVEAVKKRKLRRKHKNNGIFTVILFL